MKTRMFTGTLIAAGTALVVLAQILPAGASEASDLQTKMRSALRTAKTFVETISIKGSLGHPLGGTATYTIVAPDRFRQTGTTAGAPPDDTIIIGHDVYGNEGKGWDVQTWSDHLVTSFEGDVLNVKVASIGPDQTVDGKIVGTLVMIDPLGASDADTLQCTYEKLSSRPLACNGTHSSIKYTNYDDPTITIEAPKNAKRAN